MNRIRKAIEQASPQEVKQLAQYLAKSELLDDDRQDDRLVNRIKSALEDFGGGGDLVADLISGACEAEEVCSDDELERHADKLRAEAEES